MYRAPERRTVNDWQDFRLDMGIAQSKDDAPMKRAKQLTLRRRLRNACRWNTGLTRMLECASIALTLTDSLTGTTEHFVVRGPVYFAPILR